MILSPEDEKAILMQCEEAISEINTCGCCKYFKKEQFGSCLNPDNDQLQENLNYVNMQVDKDFLCNRFILKI